MRIKVLFAACVAVVVGGLWLTDVDELLPSSRLSNRLGSSDHSALRETENWDDILDPSKRGGGKRIVPVLLPDVAADNIQFQDGSAWTLANMSLIHSGRSKGKAHVSGASANSGSAGGGNVTNTCGVLCGRHGWGECRKGQCLCPLLYGGPDCLAETNQTFHGYLASFRPKFVSDLTVSRRIMSGEKWLQGFLPDKRHDNDHGFRVLAPINDDLLNILPVKDVIPAGKVFNSCALVGASGVLLHYEFGQEIDSHEMVMRFNRAPAKAFGIHAGNRTTHRLTSPANFGFFEHYSELVLSILRSRAAAGALIRVRQRFHQAKLAAVNPHFLYYVSKAFNITPSTGFIGIMIALQRCQSVTLYGFYAGKEQNVTYHYFNICDGPEDEERDMKEYRIVRAMARMNILTIREPCTLSCHDSVRACQKCRRRTGFKRVRVKRAKCPPCSYTREGCRKPLHWAFRKQRQWAHLNQRRPKLGSRNATEVGEDVDVGGVQEGEVTEEGEEEQKLAEMVAGEMDQNADNPFKKKKREWPKFPGLKKKTVAASSDDEQQQHQQGQQQEEKQQQQAQQEGEEDSNDEKGSTGAEEESERVKGGEQEESGHSSSASVAVDSNLKMRGIEQDEDDENLPRKKSKQKQHTTEKKAVAKNKAHSKVT